MADQFHDFDAAWQEESDEPVTIVLLGEKWECKRPSEVPAALLLKLDRLMVQAAKVAQTGQVGDDFVIDTELSSETILRQLAGDANVDAWLARGLPYKRLLDVNRYLIAVYRGQDPGEAPAANRQERRAAAKPKKPRSGSKKS
jgi:hypothetical protein